MEASFEALPDEAMLSIFTDLEDARYVAALAPVCRRWRDLSRYVDTLRFNLCTQSQANAVPAMLSRAHCIKSLTVAESDNLKLTEEQLYAWIDIVKDSLQLLDLSFCISSVGSTVKNFTDLWEHLKKCSKLSTIRVHGGVGIFFPLLKFELQNLRECILDDSSMKYPALVTILTHCPGLERLEITNFPTIKLKLFHSNVQTIVFRAEALPDPESGPPFILLEAASLRNLTLDGISCVLYAPKLVELHLPSRCKDLIVVSLDNVDLLTMGGEGWEFKEIHSVVELVPNISQLKIEASVCDPEPVVWKTFFHGLSNLTTISLGGNMLQCFCKEIDGDVLASLKIVRAAVLLQDDGDAAACLELLEALIMHCSALKLLVVNCSRLIRKSSSPSSAEEADLPRVKLFEAQQPQLFSDLQKLLANCSRVMLSFQ